ncbi:hypothetical protein, partial [Mycolicibacterium alvei]|uniref:hypothetical protein n=1 Tax=Mycolicibacterium alvei TaxID=67081 RepID=UPI0031DC8390
PARGNASWFDGRILAYWQVRHGQDAGMGAHGSKTLGACVQRSTSIWTATPLEDQYVHSLPNPAPTFKNSARRMAIHGAHARVDAIAFVRDGMAALQRYVLLRSVSG